MAECKIYKEERDVVGEIWKIDKCDMEKFGTLDSREKMIAILVDSGYRRRNRKGI